MSVKYKPLSINPSGRFFFCFCIEYCLVICLCPVTNENVYFAVYGSRLDYRPFSGPPALFFPQLFHPLKHGS